MKPTHPSPDNGARFNRWQRVRAWVARWWRSPDPIEISRLTWAWVAAKEKGVRPWHLGVIASLLLAVMLGAGVAARQWLRHYRELQYAGEAEQFLAQNNVRQAVFRSQMTLRLNPANARAIRVLARIYTEAGSTNAIYWWQREAEVWPNPTNQLAVVEAALLLESYPYPIATRTLNALPAAARQTPAARRLAGLLAAKLGHTQSATELFADALRLAPADQASQVSLAIVQLASTNEHIRAAARVTLKQLSAVPVVSLLALRPLAEDSFTRHDYGGAETLSRQILAHPQATFSDRMFYLRLLNVQVSPDFTHFLPEVEHAAGTNVPAIHQLAAWLTASGHARESLMWLTNLPPAVTKPAGLRVDMAYARVALGQWSELEYFLVHEGSWSGLEPLRLALLARAASQLAKTDEEARAWQSAMKAALNSSAAMKKLASLAVAWNWPDRAADVLWLAFGRYPDEAWVYTDLNEIYLLKKNTAKLREVSKVAWRRDPDNAEAAGNYAFYSLLLNQDIFHSGKMVEKLHAASPTNAIYARTYALALLKENRNQAALAVFQQLPSGQLRSPEVAMYYGLALVATTNQASAQGWLDQSAQLRLLPEEEALLTQARHPSGLPPQ